MNPSGALQSGITGMAPGIQVGSFDRQMQNAHAALWRDTPESMVDLNPVTAGFSSCNGTNGAAQVGSAGDVIWGNTAAVWFGSAASYVPLAQFLPAGQYFQSEAFAVSTFNGQYYVSGFASRTSDHVSEAFLWVGVPGPGGLALLAGAGLLASLSRRR